MPQRSADDVVAAVIAAVPVDPPLAPEWRWWRWAVHLPDDRLAFVADDEPGWRRLEREARLLERLAHADGVTVPALLAREPDQWVQVRRKIDGVNGFPVEHLIFGREEKVPSAERYQPRFPITDLGRRLAADLGRAIGALHGAVTADEARGWGFAETAYLDILDQVAVRLSAFPSLADLHAAVAPLRTWFAALPADPVVALRDLQMHNLAMSDADGRLLGLFDFDDAAVAHRLEDFKYLPSMGIEFVTTALDSYAEAGHPPLSLSAVWRFHVLSALEHFLFVDENSRRWGEIADWSRRAVAAQPE